MVVEEEGVVREVEMEEVGFQEVWEVVLGAWKVEKAVMDNCQLVSC